MRRLMVTGGAELIGSTLAWKLIRDTPHHVHNVNVLTYAGHLDSLGEALHHPRHQFDQVDINVS